MTWFEPVPPAKDSIWRPVRLLSDIFGYPPKHPSLHGFLIVFAIFHSFMTGISPLHDGKPQVALNKNAASVSAPNVDLPWIRVVLQVAIVMKV